MLMIKLGTLQGQVGSAAIYRNMPPHFKYTVHLMNDGQCWGSYFGGIALQATNYLLVSEKKKVVNHAALVHVFN